MSREFLILFRDGYISTFLIHNNFQRIIPGVGSEYSGGHVKPFYYYLFKFWRAFAPWSILVPAVFFYACRKGFQDKNRLFLVLWFCSGLLMLSLAGTKRTIYIVPLLPSISILTGSWFRAMEIRRADSRVYGASKWSILCVSGTGIIVLAVLAFKFELMHTIPFMLSIPLLIFSYAMVCRSFIKRRVFTLCGLPLLISMIYVSYLLVFIPYIDKRKSFKPFCNKLDEIVTVTGRPIYAFQPEETTIAVVPFYTGRKLIPVNDLEAAKSLQGDNTVFMLVLDKYENMPNYNRLKTIFPYVMLSEVVGKRRYMKLLSNHGKKG